MGSSLSQPASVFQAIGAVAFFFVNLQKWTNYPLCGPELRAVGSLACQSLQLDTYLINVLLCVLSIWIFSVQLELMNAKLLCLA
jgi:hypothetical protein